MNVLYYFLIVYLAVINLIAIIITVHDKHSAKKHKWRVKERTLLTVSALGGSVAMYITMLVICHKTKHLKFMLGIPLIFFAELAAILAVVYLYGK